MTFNQNTFCVTFRCNILRIKRGFPGSSVGEESACNAGDPGLVPGSGRSLVEGNGYPFQYSFLENSMDRDYKFTYKN